MKTSSSSQPGTCFATIASSAVRSVAASLKMGTMTESLSGTGAEADMLGGSKKANGMNRNTKDASPDGRFRRPCGDGALRGFRLYGLGQRAAFGFPNQPVTHGEQKQPRGREQQREVKMMRPIGELHVVTAGPGDRDALEGVIDPEI